MTHRLYHLLLLASLLLTFNAFCSLPEVKPEDVPAFVKAMRAAIIGKNSNEVIIVPLHGKAHIARPLFLIADKQDQDKHTDAQDLLRELLETQTVDLNMLTYDAISVFHHAVRSWKNLKILIEHAVVKKILDKKTSVSRNIARGKILDSYRDKDGQTPLHHAVEQGLVPSAMLLLQNGADADAMSDRGTPLHCAMRLEPSNTMLHTISLLRLYGVDAWIKWKGQDPLMYFCSCHPLHPEYEKVSTLMKQSKDSFGLEFKFNDKSELVLQAQNKDLPIGPIW